MTFEVIRRVKVGNTCSLIGPSNSLLLTTKVGMRDSAGPAIPGFIFVICCSIEARSDYLRVDCSTPDDCSDWIIVSNSPC